MTKKNIEKRDYFTVLKELFLSKDAALSKYAKVRNTQYELNLWRKYGLPLGEVSPKAKAYFSKRFLGCINIGKASKDQLNEALKKLDYAVGILPDGDSGCHKRCYKLVQELNGFLAELGLMTVDNPEAFLDWLTFSYHSPQNEFGKPMKEPGYSFEMKIFHNEQNLDDFKAEIKTLIETKSQMSMQDIYRVISFKRKRSIRQ